MILILAAVPLVLFENPRASAASSSAPAATTIPSQGLVCFSQVADSCPALPAQFSVPLGSTFTAYVVVQGSQAFNGFNIWFQYPYGILNATGTSLAGSVLPDAKVQFECINGKGSPSCGYWLGSGPGIVALDATGNQTVAPMTGLLYSVTFKVTGNGSGILGFFCVTSPSGPWLENCASLTNGSTRVNVGVQGAVFTTSPGTIGGTTIIVQETTSFDHVTAVVNGTLVLDSTARTLTGHLTVTLTNSTSGQVIFSRTFTVLMIFGSNPIFKFVLLIPVTPVALGAIATVDSSTARVNFFLSRNPDMANVGVVNIVDVGVVFRDYGTAQGSQSYDPAADLNANGTVDIVDAGLVVAVYGAPVFF